MVVAIVVLLASAARATEIQLPADRTLRAHAYYKNFVFGTKANISQIDDGVSDLNRFRLMLDSEIFDNWELSVHYEHIAEIHPIRGGGAFFETRDRPGLADLSWSIQETDDVAWIHEIDRLQIRGRLDWGDITIGRQAIGWGVGLIWAPLDLLVGFSPVQIDREFRLGVDAIRTVVPLGPFTEVEALYAFYDTDFDQQVAAFRWRTTLTESSTDVGLVAGKFFEDIVVGALVSGEAAGVGLHSSLNFTHHYGDDAGPEDFVRLVVGADYRFPHDVLGVVEYYFNGWGASTPSGYLSRLTSDRLQRGEVFNVGRQYLGFTVDWEAHPLVHILGRGQTNLTDPSAQVGPAITISISDEAQLEAGAFLALGSTIDRPEETPDPPPSLIIPVPASEFGPQSNFFYAAGKIYF